MAEDTSSEVAPEAAVPVRPASGFREHLGLEDVTFEDGRAVMRLEVEDRHRSPRGLLHGGAILALADVTGTALAMRSNSVDSGGDGRPMAVVGVHASILGNQAAGEVRAEAELVRRGRRITVIRVSVYGADDRLLAEMTSTHMPV